jgi:DNA-binding Xre family transcriptional regulator
MVRWRVAELLKERGWTRYRLVQESGLASPVVYRIATPGRTLGRADGQTLDALCRAFDVQPGELLEHVPDKPKRRRG